MVISMRNNFFYGGLILSLLLVICNPLAAEAIPGQGDELFLAGSFNEAIAAYLEELEIAEDPAPIYNNLGAAYYQVENIDQAIYYFQLAAEIAPDNGMPWLNLAMLNELSGNSDAAEESYLKAAASEDPIVAVNGYLGVAMLLFDKGDGSAAISALESALARTETETEAEYQEVRTQIYDNIGYIYATLGENEAAFDAFAAATQTGTESPIPWMYLGAFLQDVGMLDQALLIYQEALARDPDNITQAQEAYDTLTAEIEATASS